MRQLGHDPVGVNRAHSGPGRCDGRAQWFLCCAGGEGIVLEPELQDPSTSWPIALAAGENVRGDADFGVALASQALGFLQPDVGKWGGVTGSLRVAREAQTAGVTYCPHWLGLMTSLHLKATLAGAVWVEIDANPNPLREAFGDWIPKVLHGCITRTEAAGIGVEPPSQLLAQYLSWRGEHEMG